MSLEKKDVRAKISPEAHSALAAAAEYFDKDISEQASFILERAILGEIHAVRVMADRAARWGKNGSAGGRPADPGGHHEGNSGKSAKR